MSEEIKEILTILKEYADGFTSGMYPSIKLVTELLDYITNLQQENERLNKLIREIALNRLDYAIENARLQDYKSRIDKAIEYVKHDLAKYINPSDLLHILQGGLDDRRNME